MQYLENPPDTIIEYLRDLFIEEFGWKFNITSENVGYAITKYLKKLYDNTIDDPISFEIGISENIFLIESGASKILEDIIVSDDWSTLIEHFYLRRIFELLPKKVLGG